MSRRPSILLVYPSCFYYPEWMERLEIKTSLLWLGSYLAPRYDVRYADYELAIGRPNSPGQIRRFERHVRRHLASTDFDILAISCWASLSYRASCTVARICRELYPDRCIVVGGYHPSARPKDFLELDGLFDYVVRGEGERAMVEIAEQYAQSGRPATTRRIDGAPVPAGELVPYAWDLAVRSPDAPIPERIDSLYLFLSRGCPYQCAFCMEPIKDGSWRAIEPAAAVDTVFAAVERFGAHAVAISDACFGVRRAWRREFLDRLVQRRPPFWVVLETRAELLDPEDIRLFAHLKTEIQFGLESASPRMLTVMNKTRSPARYLRRFAEVSRQLSDHGVLHRANMIFNHPGESLESLRETYDFIDGQLARRDSTLIWVTHGYMHFPGCEVDRNRSWYEERYGTRFPNEDWWKGDTDQRAASGRVVPSRELDGDRLDLWERMWDARLEAMKSSLTPAAYDFAARKYFLEWQDDRRAQHA